MPATQSCLYARNRVRKYQAKQRQVSAPVRYFLLRRRQNRLCMTKTFCLNGDRFFPRGGNYDEWIWKGLCLAVLKRERCENVRDTELSICNKQSQKISSQTETGFCPRPTFFVATEINPSLHDQNFLSKWGQVFPCTAGIMTNGDGKGFVQQYQYEQAAKMSAMQSCLYARNRVRKYQAKQRQVSAPVRYFLLRRRQNRLCMTKTFCLNGDRFFPVRQKLKRTETKKASTNNIQKAPGLIETGSCPCPTFF